MFSAKPASAATCPTVGGCTIFVKFFNDDNITWQVHYWNVYDSNIPKSMAVSGYVWISPGSSASVPIEGLNQGDPLPANVYATWATSCADPSVTFSVPSGSSVSRVDGGYTFYYYSVASSCQSPGTVSCSGTTYYNAKFAACRYVPSSGTVGFTAQCPQTVTNRYCATAGNIYGIAGTYCALLCNTGYACDGVCHEEKQINTCSGSYCVNSNATRYNGSCTAGCCAYSAAPATPSLNNATGLSCLADNDPNNVTVNWDATARATNYTLQYRDCGVGGGSCGSWTSVDRNTSLSYTIPIPNSDQGHTYQWRVKADNCYGTTYSTTKSFVVPDCHPPKGNFDGATCTPGTTPNMWGWACQAYNNYNTQLTVVFKDGTTTIGSTIANVANEAAVTTACGGSTVGHRFNYTPPASVINDAAHTIHAYAQSQLPGSALTELTSSPKTFGQCKYDVTTNVYQDLNGNGVKDTGEPAYQGATVAVSGPNNASNVTNSSGQFVFLNLDPGNYNVSLTVPTGYKQTTPKDINGNPLNPVPETLGPNQTVNFGIVPPAPKCSGGLQASPTTVHPGDTSTLTAVGCTTGGQGGTLTYTWLSPTPGTIITTNPSAANTATWKAPTPYWKDIYAYPTVNVCQTGTNLCTPYGINNGVGVNNSGIHIVPLFSISGDVFVDQNKDGLQNSGDVNYTGAITIGSSGGTVTYPAPAGNYLISNLPGGTYTISYSWPNRYVATNPKATLRPATFTVTVGNTTTGTACNTNGAVGAACDNGADPSTQGNITSLRFGISNSMPWIQTISGDLTGANVSDPNGGGFANPIPAGATCGTYTSLLGSVAGGGTTPGIVYSGAGAYDFGSGQASQNPYNWVVGGVSYPDVYQPRTAGVITTSYSYITSIAKQSGITPTDLSSYCGGGGLGSCTLPSNLPNGVYLADGGLTLTGPSYTFPANKNYVILVNGDLNLNTEIHVPVGSTATFSSSNDIIVGQNVGTSNLTSITPNLEGYFSADKHFTIKGVNSCPTTDLRLNVAGSIVVNAALNSASSLATQANFVSGGFVNERDLCSTDLQCPAFSITERPDFVIYAPDFFKTTRRIWREIAP